MYNMNYNVNYNLPSVPNYIKTKYEFVDTNSIGEGGFGTIYRIRDKKLFNEYVLKKYQNIKQKKNILKK